jgi:rubredoxin
MLHCTVQCNRVGFIFLFQPPFSWRRVSSMSDVVEFKSWVCLICGWVYNESEGYPQDGLAPGTRFEDIPDNWRCPDCDVGKEDFVMVEF